MIDWNKPIETVDGREAKFVKEMMTGCIVYVLQQFGRRGDVFLVSDKGCRRDDRASDRERQEPFIRNVRVKRKAWIRLPIYDYHKADTKEECEASITKSGYKAVYCEWEEEP